MIIGRRLRGIGAADSRVAPSPRTEMSDPSTRPGAGYQTGYFVLHADEGPVIDTDGEVIGENRSPLDAPPPGTPDGKGDITDVAAGSTLRTWGPPLALAAVVLGAVWWLRK